MGGTGDAPAQAVPRPWRMRELLSRFADRSETMLAQAGFDRGPWIAVAFAGGIGLWFALDSPWQWSATIGLLMLIALAAIALWRDRDERAHLKLATVAAAIVIAAGLAIVWARSELIGAEPIERPRFERMDARILEREEQPSRDRVRLTVAVRDAETGTARAYRINIHLAEANDALREGARIRLAARLMPPSPPIVPGAYDFARRAWFEGLSATGSVTGDIEIVEGAGARDGWTAQVQRALSAHVRSRVEGAPGAIAATLASGDRGSISEENEAAMRDAGLTHLLSISGLHVSAIIAAVYLITLKLLALWPWLALRLRLPVVAAGAAALAGMSYTLLTGAEVPTVRSCLGALLVLIALVLGREALTLRLVAIAAMAVLLLWPEALVGPSFQMSFAAVIAIVALHNSSPVRTFLSPREESWFRRSGRRVIMLFATGLVIELALMPIVLFHFHRAGLYGAGANLLAIPLVTFASMPLVALALFLDLFGLGAPAWWLVGRSLEVLLGIAHFVSAQPGAVKLAPTMPMASILVFLAGALWMALWHGRLRLWGIAPMAVGALWMWATPAPDIVITRDGRDVGIASAEGRLLVLRDSDGSYAQENLREVVALEGQPIPLERWPAARCSSDFCTLVITVDGRSWRLLIARSRELIEERALAAACDQSDIVIADRFLPRSCRPRWLKADRRFLQEQGGTALYLGEERIETVAKGQGEHGWFKPNARK